MSATTSRFEDRDAEDTITEQHKVTTLFTEVRPDIREARFKEEVDIGVAAEEDTKMDINQITKTAIITNLDIKTRGSNIIEIITKFTTNITKIIINYKITKIIQMLAPQDKAIKLTRRG